MLRLIPNTCTPNLVGVATYIITHYALLMFFFSPPPFLLSPFALYIEFALLTKVLKQKLEQHFNRWEHCKCVCIIITILPFMLCVQVIVHVAHYKYESYFNLLVAIFLSPYNSNPARLISSFSLSLCDKSVGFHCIDLK